MAPFNKIPSWVITLVIMTIGGLVSWSVTLAEVKQEVRISLTELKEKVKDLEERPPAGMSEATREAFKGLVTQVEEIRKDVREVRNGQAEILRYLREVKRGGSN